MKRLIIIFLIVFLFVWGCSNKKSEEKQEVAMPLDLGVNIEHIGHASFKISAEKIIYIDPFNIKDKDPADIILITHAHFDHCSIKDIEKLIKPGTEIFAVPDCQSKLNHFDNVKINLVQPNKVYTSGSIKIETVPAYNVNKKFHPKANDWVGYIITINKKRIYHAGDTDFIPEMKSLRNIDIALLPIGGTYTMDVDEAATAANTFKPKILIPMHYNVVQGTEADPKKLESKLDKSIKLVVI